ncbi:MAG: hypothetical protein II844_10215 [Prevotella sp.]|nr:hypothetical protein [Prevotella sp.]
MLLGETGNAIADYQQVTELPISRHTKPSGNNFRISQGNGGRKNQSVSEKVFWLTLPSERGNLYRLVKIRGLTIWVFRGKVVTLHF